MRQRKSVDAGSKQSGHSEKKNRQISSSPKPASGPDDRRVKSSLEQYLQTRRSDAPGDFAFDWISFDQFFMLEKEIEDHGIDPHLVAGVFDCDLQCITELSLQLLENVVDRSSLSRAGETNLQRQNKAIPDRLLDWLAVLALQRVSKFNLEFPQELLVLVQSRLTGLAFYNSKSESDRCRFHAILTGAQLVARGKKPSFKSIAKKMNVPTSTVSRWAASKDWDWTIRKFSELFDEEGRLRSRINDLTNELHEK